MALLLGALFISDFVSFRDWFHLWLGIGWVLIGLLGFLPPWKSKRKVMVERGEMGLCPHCAYNLKGNVSRVCPECGKPFRTH